MQVSLAVSPFRALTCVIAVADLEEYSAALTHYKQALSTDEVNEEAERQILLELGVLLESLDDMDVATESLASIFRSVQLRRGQDNEATVALASSLAVLFAQRGRTVEALNYSTLVVGVATRTIEEDSSGELDLPPDTPDDLEDTIAQLAGLHYQQGNDLEALRFYRIVIALLRKRSTAPSRRLAEVLEVTGDILQELQQYQEALILFQDALGIRRVLGGAGHADDDLRRAMLSVAVCLHRTDQPDAAAALLRERLAMARTDADAADPKRHLALILAQQGEYDKAFELYEDALSALRDVEDAQYKVSGTLESLAAVRFKQSNFSGALHFYQLSLDLDRNRSAAAEVLVKRLQSIASAHIRLQQLEEARAALSEALYLLDSKSRQVGAAGVGWREWSKTLVTLGLLERRLGQDIPSLALFKRASVVLEEHGGRSGWGGEPEEEGDPDVVEWRRELERVGTLVKEAAARIPEELKLEL